MNTVLAAFRHSLRVAVAFALSSALGCASVHESNRIEGRVIDADTSAPVEGVVVVASWELRGGFEGNQPVGVLQILESVTDKEGRYGLPAWGPKVAASGTLGASSPRLLLFKPGYRFAGFSNVYYQTTGTSSFFYDKKDLKIEPFRGTPIEYARHLSSLNGSLWQIGYRIGYQSGDYCGWKSFPRMLRALDAQEAQFRRAGIVEGTVVSELRAAAEQLRAKNCGTVDELITK